MSELVFEDGNVLEEPNFSDLVPINGDRPAEVVRFETVVLTDIPGSESDALAPLSGPVDLGAADLNGYSRPGEGVIVTAEQRWLPRGVTLGRLLHSLALAPGESTRVAIVSFDRSETGRKTTDNRARDELSRLADESRSIEDSGRASTREEQTGSSAQTSSAVQASAAGSSGIALGALGSASGNYSRSQNDASAQTVTRSGGVREAATSAVQDIQARTMQNASAVRSQTAAVVRETSQREASQVSTRVVTNYNHMHAMTVCYYEVVQQYDVVTVPVRIDRCVFVPMAQLRFTDSVVRRFAPILAAAAPPEWAGRIAGSSTTTAVSRTRIVGTSGSVGEASAAYVPSTPGGSQTFSHLAAAVDGTVVAVTADGRLMRFSASTEEWERLPDVPGAAAAKVAVGRADLIYVVGSDNRIYRLTASGFQPFGNNVGPWVSCASDGSVFFIGFDQVTYRIEPDGKRTSLGGQGSVITAADRSRVWHLGGGNQVWRSTKDGSGWLPDPYATPPFAASITAAADGALWMVTTDNDVKFGGRLKSDGFQDPPWAGPVGKLKYVAPVSDDVVWGLRPNGQPVRIRRARPVTAFSDAAADAEPSVLETWSDGEVLRGIRLTMRGVTGRAFSRGDTSGAGLTRDTYTFVAGAPPVSIEVHTTPAETGAIRGLTVNTSSGPSVRLGAAGDGVPIPLDGATICGLIGEVTTAPRGAVVTQLGFSVRTTSVDEGVLRHLNADAERYSRAVWARADEDTLSRVLAGYTYAPTEPGDAPTEPPAPLGARVDPRPVAMTGNYLAFRWNYPREEQRLDWLRRARGSGRGTPVEGDEKSSPRSIVALPSGGVFAEAVLGRSNSAEKLDITRFWNWQESPIPILPPEIDPVSANSRAREVDTSGPGFDASAASFEQLEALPAPTAMGAVVQSLTANIFRDMSAAQQTAALAQQALTGAASGEQAAGANALEAGKAAMAHYQRMSELAIQAATQLLPMTGAGRASGGSAPSGGGGESTSLRGALYNQTGTFDGSLPAGNGRALEPAPKAPSDVEAGAQAENEPVTRQAPEPMNPAEPRLPRKTTAPPS